MRLGCDRRDHRGGEGLARRPRGGQRTGRGHGQQHRQHGEPPTHATARRARVEDREQTAFELRAARHRQRCRTVGVVRAGGGGQLEAAHGHTRTRAHPTAAPGRRTHARLPRAARASPPTPGDGTSRAPPPADRSAAPACRAGGCDRVRGGAPRRAGPASTRRDVAGTTMTGRSVPNVIGTSASSLISSNGAGVMPRDAAWRCSAPCHSPSVTGVARRASRPIRIAARARRPSRAIAPSSQTIGARRSIVRVSMRGHANPAEETETLRAPPRRLVLDPRGNVPGDLRRPAGLHRLRRQGVRRRGVLGVDDQHRRRRQRRHPAERPGGNHERCEWQTDRGDQRERPDQMTRRRRSATQELRGEPREREQHRRLDRTGKQQREPRSRGGQGPVEWEGHGYRPSRWAFSIIARMRAMSTGPLRSSCRSRSAATASSVDPSKNV